jgi:hypothetical protein
VSFKSYLENSGDLLLNAKAIFLRSYIELKNNIPNPKIETKKTQQAQLE